MNKDKMMTQTDDESTTDDDDVSTSTHDDRPTDAVKSATDYEGPIFRPCVLP